MMDGHAKSDLEKYVQHLQYHDWYFNYADDHRVWEAGNAAAHKLHDEQKRLDPEFLVWNQYAPKAFCVHLPKDKDL
jgi:hypothetical protein